MSEADYASKRQKRSLCFVKGQLLHSQSSALGGWKGCDCILKAMLWVGERAVIAAQKRPFGNAINMFFEDKKPLLEWHEFITCWLPVRSELLSESLVFASRSIWNKDSRFKSTMNDLGLMSFVDKMTIHLPSGMDEMERRPPCDDCAFRFDECDETQLPTSFVLSCFYIYISRCWWKKS